MGRDGGRDGGGGGGGTVEGVDVVVEVEEGAVVEVDVVDVDVETVVGVVDVVEGVVDVDVDVGGGSTCGPICFSVVDLISPLAA